MVKKTVITLVIMMLIGVSSHAEIKEILFRNTQWGISFTEAQALFNEFDLQKMSGEYYSPHDFDDILLDSPSWDRFEYNDIDIYAFAKNGKQNVAGYETSGVYLYFAYLPNDGILTKDVNETALYAAQYRFDVSDIDAVYSDLVDKLKTIYGIKPKLPYTAERESLGYIYKCYYWKGENQTGVALTRKTEKESLGNGKEIYLTYFTTEGINWLQNACDAEERARIVSEQTAKQSGDISGL